MIKMGAYPHRLGALTVLASLLAGCATTPFTGQGSQRIGKGEAAILLGPPVRTNQTPLEASLACFADHLAATQYGNTVIGVGEIKDYTGKYSINEGNAVTQGGSLMVYSALGKLGNVITIAERYDPSIGERELGYVDRRQLGDGQFHDVDGQKVRWLPYYGGSIARSDYYIVGGITELNYNVSSGGAELGMNGIGGKTRVYNQSVAIDLRIVDSKTLLVLKTVSLTKQYTGHEVGLNIFRFFGSDLFDVNIGSRAQEPLQLGIRATLEEATMRLVGAVTRIDPEPCLTKRTSRFSDQPAEKLYGRALDGRPILNPLVAAQREALAHRANGISVADPLLPGLVKNMALPSAPTVAAAAKPAETPPAAKAADRQLPAPPPIPSSDGRVKAAQPAVPSTTRQPSAQSSAAPTPSQSAGPLAALAGAATVAATSVASVAAAPSPRPSAAPAAPAPAPAKVAATAAPAASPRPSAAPAPAPAKVPVTAAPAASPRPSAAPVPAPAPAPAKVAATAAPAASPGPSAAPAAPAKVVASVAPAPSPLPSAVPAAPAPAPAKVAVSSGPTLLNRMPASGASAGTDASAQQIQFEFGSVTIASASISTIEAIAARWQQGPVNVTLVARDIENLDPAKRDALIDQRLAILLFALERKGVPKAAIRTTWRPARNDATIYRDGPGLQEIAKIRLEK